MTSTKKPRSLVHRHMPTGKLFALLKTTAGAITILAVSWAIGGLAAYFHPFIPEMDGLSTFVLIAAISAFPGMLALLFVVEGGALCMLCLAIAIASGLVASGQVIVLLVGKGGGWLDPIALFLVVFLAAGLAMLFWMDTIEVSLTTAELAGKLMEKPRPERGDSLMDKPCPECGGSGTVTGDWEPDWMISLSGCGGGEGGSYRTETCGSCAGTGRESSG